MSQFFFIGHWESKAIHKKSLSQLLTKLRHLAIFKIHIMDPHSDLPGLSDYDSDDEDDFDIVEDWMPTMSRNFYKHNLQLNNVLKRSYSEQKNDF